MGVSESVNAFYKRFGGEKGNIGFSENGIPLRYIKVQKTEKPIVIVACAIHAREYITSYFCLREITEYQKKGTVGTVYFIPAVNPDGIRICESKKPLFKANARGVDLNVNFDARWGTGKSNSRTRGDENYIGPYPFSERETKALRDFTLYVKPHLTVSYHTKGEEIYYKFFQDGKNLERDFMVANALSKYTGYAVKETPYSAGGYKDWCVQSLGITALTVEMGSDRLSHPIKRNMLGEILKDNVGSIDLLCRETLKWI